MKKQKSFLSLIGALVLTSLLSACPPQPNPQGSPSPGISASPSGPATPTAPPVSATLGPAPAAFTQPPLTAFPKEHLICCWDALVQKDPTYPKLTLDALNGNLDALEKLLTMVPGQDLNPGYAHGAALAEILVRIGDERFAYVLRKLDLAGTLSGDQKLFQESIRENLRNLLEGGFALNSDPPVHMKNLTAYPETAKVLKYITQAKKG